MRLYWEMQKKDRERIVRRYEEEKLEADTGRGGSGPGGEGVH